jgi:hypothetical protein
MDRKQIYVQYGNQKNKKLHMDNEYDVVEQ